MFKRLTVLALTLLVSMSAAAQDVVPDNDRTAAAREQYSLAAEAFGQGRFQEALNGFTRAYEYSSRGELLYNIGATHDRLGHRESALRFYQDYVEAIPDADNRDYTVARMAVLEREIVEAAAAEAAAEDAIAAREAAATVQVDGATEPNASADDSGAKVPAIALISVAGAAAVGAVVTGVLALGQRGELEDACPGFVCTSDNQSELDRLNTLTITTDVLIGVAGVAAVVGVVLFVVGGDEDDVEVACGLSGCNAQMRF